jgi:hypothetical protein
MARIGRRIQLTSCIAGRRFPNRGDIRAAHLVFFDKDDLAGANLGANRSVRRAGTCGLRSQRRAAGEEPGSPASVRGWMSYCCAPVGHGRPRRIRARRRPGRGTCPRRSRRSAPRVRRRLGLRSAGRAGSGSGTGPGSAGPPRAGGSARRILGAARALTANRASWPVPGKPQRALPHVRAGLSTSLATTTIVHKPITGRGGASDGPHPSRSAAVVEDG